MINKVSDNWSDNYYLYTNSLGFKDFYPKKIKYKSQNRRILFIGDSFTEGIGCPVENTFYGLISLALRTDSIEILNAGVSSYSPHLYYLKTKYLTEEKLLDFQELYVFIDISDIIDEMIYENYKPTPIPTNKIKNFLLNYEKKHSAIMFIFNNIKKHFISNKTIIINTKNVVIDDADYKHKEKWTSMEYYYKKWARFGVEYAKHYMQNLVELCNSRGIKMKIVIYPHPFQISQHIIIDRQVETWTKFAADNKIEIINLYPDFMKEDPDKVINKYFIPGDIHWNYLGHQIVAKKILDNIN